MHARHEEDVGPESRSACDAKKWIVPPSGREPPCSVHRSNDPAGKEGPAKGTSEGEKRSEDEDEDEGAGQALVHTTTATEDR